MITVTLKTASTKTMRLRVTGHYQGEYLYSKIIIYYLTKDSCELQRVRSKQNK